MGNALRHVRGESQKNIVRFIEGLSGKYSRWDIWQDFIIMSAIAIANTMGGPQAKAREEMYRSRAEKYSAKELEVFADKPTALTPEEEAKEREEQLKQERKDAAEKALSEATARAYELRADFVATVSTAAIKKRLADIVALWAYAEYWDDTGWLTEEEIAQATGAETLAEDDEDGEDDAAFTLQAVTDAIGKTPEKALLRMIYARLGDGKSEGYFRSYWNSYTMKHEENEKLDRIYALLVKLGYEMSDDEKALQDGTHELFGEVTDE